MKLNIKNVRIGYVNVFKPRQSEAGKEPQYSVQLLIPKDHPQLSTIKEMIASAAIEKFDKDMKAAAGKWPARLNFPLRDGDAEFPENDSYKGMLFMNVRNTRKPMVIDRLRRAVTEEDNLIYSGCYANVVVSFFAYDKRGNKGVTASLQGVQFKADGEPLAGVGVSIADFDVEEDDSEAEDAYDFLG